MVMCFVPDCRHYSAKHSCKFFRFPKNQAEANKWISLIRRKDTKPSKFARVCDCHFVDKERKNRPTLFNFNTEKKFTVKSPEKRTRTVQDSQVPGLSKRLHSDEKVELLPGPSTQSCSQNQSRPGPSNRLDCDCDEEAEPLPGPSTESCSQNQVATNVKLDDMLLSPSSASQEAENYFLRQEVAELKEKLNKLTSRFNFEAIRENDAHILMYTGIPTKELFMVLFKLMDNVKLKYYAGWNVQLISKIDQLLMTLMKLRLNLPHEDLSIRFNCSTATVTNIIMTWIYALHEVLFKNLLKTIPSRQKNKACLPAAFENFKNCRIILDCTEIYSVVPTSMEKQRLTYSSYKHRNTWKILVGIAPNGVITFVSKAYPGSTSDKKVVEQSKVLEQMVPGDLILADKGFLIRDLLPAGVSLNIPPFLTTPQFTESQVYETQQIAKARIHVERAIRRIKCYNILQQVPAHYISEISIIFQLCAALTNFQYPLIKEVEEYY